jgi:hypothetical protein
MRWGVVLLTVVAVVILSTPTVAANGCGGLLAALGYQLTDISCIESRPHHQQPGNNAGQRFFTRAGAFCVYTADRPRRDFAEPAEPHADYQGCPGHPAGCPHVR